MAENRTRNWTFVVYPESLPSDWQSIIADWKIEAAVSPLHDADINGDGSEKKEHYHVMCCFDGNKSFSQVQEFARQLGSEVPPQPVNSCKGLIRYFCHLDNPEKAQYSISQIKCFGGLNIKNLLVPTRTEEMKFVSEMQQFIVDNTILSFAELADWAKDHRFDDWYPVLFSKTFFIREYIKAFKSDYSKKIKADICNK